MTATPESDFSQSRNAAERAFIAKVNRELDERFYSLAPRFQVQDSLRRGCLIDDVPRYIDMRDDEIGCEGRFVSTSLRWCDKRSGVHGNDVLTLVGYLLGMTEFDVAQVIWRHTQSFEPARLLVRDWMRGLRRMPSPAELRAAELPWTPLRCRHIPHPQGPYPKITARKPLPRVLWTRPVPWRVVDRHIVCGGLAFA